MVMDFSTDHSFFKTPLLYYRAVESRPNPNRQRENRKHKLEDDEDDDVGDLGAYADQDEHELEDHPSENNKTGQESITTVEVDVEPSLGRPSYPTNPRKLVGERRYQQNLETLTHLNLFLPPRKPPCLRSRHEAILNTILHMSIMKRDWDRAKRAFGMLVRGKWIDVRKVWAVGGDLLLQPNNRQGSISSEEGMRRNQAQAIEYLNRMVLQFPFQGNRIGQRIPRTTDAEFTTFESERAETKQVKQQKQVDMGKIYHASSLDFYPFLIASLIGSSGFAGNEKREDGSGGTHMDSQQEEYYLDPSHDLLSPSHPQKIKEQLEEIMITPPWSDDLRLWCIRGMICLWMADLEIPNIPQPVTSDGLGDDGYETPASMLSDNEDEDEMQWKRKRKERLAQLRAPQELATRRQRLLSEAKSHLDKVEQKGGSLPFMLKDALCGIVETEQEEE